MKKILTWLLYALAFTPLVVTKSLFFPYVSGKTIFVRVIIALVCAGAVGFSIYSRESREVYIIRLRNLFKTVFGWGIGLFSLILMVSTFFAQNPYRAFFGDVERGEGLIGVLFFIGFFFASYLIFERREWLTFLKLSFISGGILFVHMLAQFAGGMRRPSSFTGNPIYLAAYYLFIILAAGIVYLEYSPRRENSRLWRMVALCAAGLSVLGIFITETRGVIVGLAAAIFFTLVYFVFKGNEVTVRGYSLRRWAGVIFLVVVVFGGVFIGTRHASLWNRIPGFDRLSTFTFNDATTQTRLISLGIGLQAINPAQNGVGKLLLGWGLENFDTAYNTYFNPAYFRYETAWFDRAHDKLVDVFVMNGLLGLIGYGAMWGALFWWIFKKKFSWESIVVLFFGVSYFVQNLFVFDSVTTYIPFFAFLAYSAYWHISDSHQAHEHTSVSPVVSGMFAGSAAAVSIFFVIACVWWTIVPMSQIRQYISVFSSGSITKDNISQLDASFTPYTYVQELIRTHFLSNVRTSYEQQPNDTFMLYAIGYVKDLVAREGDNPRYWIQLGQAYDDLGKNNPIYFPDAQQAYEAAHALAPKRQDIYYLLAYNASFQKQFSRSIQLLEEAIALDPQVSGPHFYLGMVLVGTNDAHNYKRVLSEFARAQQISPGLYAGQENYLRAHYFLLRHFYDMRDASSTLETVRQMRDISSVSQDALNAVEQSVLQKTWKPINFQ